MTATQTIVKKTKKVKITTKKKNKNNNSKRCGECGKFKK